MDAAQTLHVPAECGSLELLWPWWVGGANVRNFSCHHKYFRLRSESPALCLESFGQGGVPGGSEGSENNQGNV